MISPRIVALIMGNLDYELGDYDIDFILENSKKTGIYAYECPEYARIYFNWEIFL